MNTAPQVENLGLFSQVPPAPAPFARRRRFLCSLLLLLGLWLSAAGAWAAEVTVFAASSLTDSLKEIGANYQQQTGDTLHFNFGASSTLARQIEAGAPADLFFSADTVQMNRLEGKGLIQPATRTNLLSNTLVIIVAAKAGATVRSPEDLVSPAIHRIALGNPKAVPIGRYAREYFEKIGLWAAIEPKVVPTENVRAALAAVEAGNADASIVYKTDAAISQQVKVAFTVPVVQGPRISYPAALVKDSKAPNAATRFLAYLTSEPATQAFEKFGFHVLSSSRQP